MQKGTENNFTSKVIMGLLLISIVPFLLLLKDIDFGNSWSIIHGLGSIFGFMGATVLLWQVILGVRIISEKIPLNRVWFDKFHRNLGKYGTLLAFAHPFLSSLTFSGSIKMVFIPDLNYPLLNDVGFGRIAFYLLILIFVTSVFFRKKLSFKNWKYIHYLSYVILFFVYLHPLTNGTFLNKYLFLEYYWYFQTGLFYLVFIYRVYLTVRKRVFKANLLSES